ncbi:MAG TPA: exodeoxyribonuclease VII small subunit [Candidatus Acidoferrum sp.]|nr:exodeoxyribonuclease VII small subunit [Candidatus Acidoferrum sp.]
MTTKRKYKDYESAVERLEEITTRLEAGDTKLDEAISLYTEGLEIAKFCSQKLTDAEKKIKIISESSGVTSEEDFDAGDGENENEEEE